ncbi:MAG: NADP-dependent phosphogluconate dehydrogenase, partial [Gammaproteobacteria bacterium]|nr:NADP-dependent phosphogluconate dehydrogenase [Gammaproteobacteria bacterium]
MELGMIGLGRMGANMARRLQKGGIEVVAWNRDVKVTQDLAQETGLTAASNLADIVSRLKAPRIVWLMLPAGEVTQQHIDQLSALLSPDDIVVDGANSYYKDSMRRGQELTEKKLHYIDAGVSGGVWGLENGYALMLGGEKAAMERLKPAIQVLAPGPESGWLHCGPTGAGHFVKMVHNGIEYGMMQAYAEGFALMKGREDFKLDLGGIAEMWRHGSVVRSWLLDLTAEFLASDQELKDIAP